MFIIDSFYKSDSLIYIALAYAYNGIVFAHTQWKSTKFKAVVKQKTTVLLDEDEEVAAFGQIAKHMLRNMLYKISVCTLNIILYLGILKRQKDRVLNGCYLRDLRWHYMMV